jgi:hypothetical protein
MWGVSLFGGYGFFIQVIFEDIADAFIGTGTCKQSPLTGIVQPAGAIRPVELNDPHSPFIAGFRVIAFFKYSIDNCQNVFTVPGCLVFKIPRAPVRISFVGAA